ncbi:hypothetical protein [Methanoregula sp. PtaB.Bin085]|uniref:hypothetical protein n=1 Tax=Methanoregula sp. PtaB.Bin085 TaxID=1811680 RepID=UPI0009CAB1D0|nr:hypothetical protein [Methanoregula sp. PtaB.Bin085]OPX63457.1 MAG: hypothetical protein A4E33_01646 [Methanoregula sp. PtaB.Bin085]
MTQEQPESNLPNRAAFIMVAVILGIAIVYSGYLLNEFIHPVGTCCGTRIVALSANQEDNQSINITYLGGADASALCGIRINVTDSTGKTQIRMIGQEGPVTSQESFLGITGNDKHVAPPVPAIGENLTFSGNFSGRDHILAFAYFNDGKWSYVMDMNI